MEPTEGSPSRRRRRWRFRLAALGGGLLLSLVLGEGLVRVAGGGGATLSRGGLYAFDPDAGWRCLPGLDTRYVLPGSFDARIVCNSQGLRDTEKATPKPPGVRRVLVLGDSFMWGYGVQNDEMFSTVLGERLEGFESVNCGVSGYSTVQELFRLKTDGPRYEPEWTVLAFCSNDLDGNFDDKGGRRPRVALGADGALSIANHPVPARWGSSLGEWVRGHSRLFGFLRYTAARLKLWYRQRQAAARLEAGPGPPPAIDDDMVFSVLELYAPPSPQLDTAWEVEVRLLERIRDEAAGQGSRLLVCYVPNVENVLPDGWAEVEAMAAEAGVPVDWDRPSRRLGQVCGELGVPYLDLVEVFRAQDDPRGLFLVGNGHWSARGHRLAAEAAASRLSELMGPAAAGAPTPD